MDSVKSQRLLRRRQMLQKCGLSYSSAARFIKEGSFPAPVQIGPRCVAWVETGLDLWVANRIAERG